MEPSQAGAVPPERIRYRLTHLQRMLPMLPAACLVLATQVSFWLGGGPSRPALFAGLFWAAVLVLSLITPRPIGITLTSSAAVVHRFRRRTIPWADVQAICVEPQFGVQTVVIYEAGGRCTRLRAPITGWLNWDRGFEEKFHTIGRWWLDHRGPDWVPVPPPLRWSGPPAPDGNPYAPPA